MKAIFRILGTAAAVAATGAAIVIMDKLLNEKAAPINILFIFSDIFRH